MSCSIQKLCQDSQENIDPVLEIENNCVSFFKDVLNNHIRLKGIINKNKITEESDFTNVILKFNTIHFDIIPVDDIPSKIHLNFDFKNFFIITKKGILCILNNKGKNFQVENQYITIDKQNHKSDSNYVDIKFKYWKN